ncbi:MAG TPA: hypothetical protein VLI54_03610 [Bacillota bacterium]|nr:hypothetical protein [Bacillota bacterium]
MIGARAFAHQPVLRQLAAGVRASKRRVGYLGSETALTTLNNGDPLPGGWVAHWDTGALIVTANNVTIDHYRIHGSVVFNGDNPTMTNCVVYCNPDDIFGVTISGSGHGVLTITDTTVIGDPSGISPQVNGISSDSGLVARRCDVSKTGDGIHLNAQSNINNAIISQCYIHDQGFVDESQHCDGIQIFNDNGGFFTVEHCYIASSPSTIGTPMNSAMTCGTATNDTTALATPIINNNYFDAGLYHLRVNYRLHNSTVTNNDIGPVHGGEFGTYDIITPVATWSGNRDPSGNPVSNPNPVVTPTIKETLQTTDGQLSTQVLSTTAGTTLAGDTILVVYATDNNTAGAPTSTAGTLTQIGTDAVNGDGNGLLRVYSVPVASSGSKNVTIPAAGGFDIMGAVFVLSGSIEVEGFIKTNYNPSISSFVTPAATFAGGKNLLLALLLNTSGRTFDLSSSGLTQRANPKCLPFSALTVGSAIMSSTGATPTYTVTMDNPAKPAAVIIGLQKL